MKNVKIFTDNVDETALEQIELLMEQEAFKNSKVRIMPDVHAGKGCVIGFTGDLGDKVIPNIVGVDIGCGMLTVELGNIEIDFDKLDKIIKRNVPSGFKAHKVLNTNFDLKRLYCYNKIKNKDHILKSMGTLGGGNHFIEIDVDEKNNKYLIIHTGSRNLGKQVAEIYQNRAIEYCRVSIIKKEQIIKRLKEEGKEKEIEEQLKEINIYKPPKDLCYLEGREKDKYLHDMRIAMEFASKNREEIARRILVGLRLDRNLNRFETIHNYIGDDNIVRKGAISAHKDEIVLIPINMRDGCIIARGKGNKDWNCSAPHGAGRIMSRKEARSKLKLEDYKETMKDIYTTSIDFKTLDEAPFAYKPMKEILDNIGDTVEIIKIIKPIYNYKSKD